MALDDEAQGLQKARHGGGGWVAVARRVVRGDLDDLGEETRLGVPARVDEGVDRGLEGGRHGVSRCIRPLRRTEALDRQARFDRKDLQNPSMRMPS